MIAFCMNVCWRFFEIISRYLEECYYYWYHALGWKHTHLETTEAEYAHQQRKELHDRVYQQNISDEGLFSFFEELISKSS